jgi:glycosyltransferase involved in cell wall biosynthesis
MSERDGGGHGPGSAPAVVVSMNFTHVGKSGGVIDVAENLVAAMRPLCGERLAVVRPRRRASRVAQVAWRYLSELALEFRWWRQPAVALFPNYFICPLPFSRLRRVVVVHDLQFKHLPRYTSASKRLVLELSYRCARRFADGVVFISAATRDDFLRFYGAPRRAMVIPNPVAIDSPAEPAALRPYPYAIANFHDYPHKNIAGLLDCFDALRARWPELRLLLTGNRSADADRLLGGDALARGVEHLGFLPKSEVFRLIMGSRFFISLSRFEGFNMSAAEAALLGKPLVLSDIPVHREMFGDIALLVRLDTAVDPDAVLRYVEGEQSPGGPSWAFRERVAPAVVAQQYLSFMARVRADPPP